MSLRVRLFLLILLLLPSWAWGQALSRREAALLNPLEYGSACTTATLSAAISAAPATGRVLMLTPVQRDGTPCVWAITSNVTVPSTLVLHVPQGASVAISSGVTLTLARYPREDNRAWKTGTGTLVITEPDPMGRFNVKDFGAVGDGVTIDRNAIMAAFTTAAASTKVIYFPSGSYFVGSIQGSNNAFLDLSAFGSHLTIQTEKNVEIVCNTPTNGIPYIFYLRNNSHLRMGPIRFRDIGYDDAIIWKGAAGIAIAADIGDQWGDLLFEGIYGFRLVYPVTIVGNGGATYRVRGIHIKQLYSDDCFYGFNAQNQGDGVLIDNMIAYRNYRPYFVYGVTGHKVSHLLNRHNRATSGMINIARLNGGLNTHDIEINYVARDMTAVGTTPHVLINHIDLLGGEISNIRLDVDVNDPLNPSNPQFPVRFTNYTGSGGVETNGASPNIVKDIRLSGSARLIDDTVRVNASYASKGRLEFRSGTQLVLHQTVYDAFALHPQGRGSVGIVWTAETANPTLGDGILIYDLDIVDGMCTINMQLHLGSTTVAGLGPWSFAGFGVAASVLSHGVCLAVDTGGGNYWTGVAQIGASSGTIQCFPNNAPTQFGVSVPFGWSTGDILYITITFPLS